MSFWFSQFMTPLSFTRHYFQAMIVCEGILGPTDSSNHNFHLSLHFPRSPEADFYPQPPSAVSSTNVNRKTKQSKSRQEKALGGDHWLTPSQKKLSVCFVNICVEKKSWIPNERLMEKKVLTLKCNVIAEPLSPFIYSPVRIQTFWNGRKCTSWIKWMNIGLNTGLHSLSFYFVSYSACLSQIHSNTAFVIGVFNKEKHGKYCFWYSDTNLKHTIQHTVAAVTVLTKIQQDVILDFQCAII